VSGPAAREPQIELRPAPPCPVCGGALLLAARVPVLVGWMDGQSVPSYRTVTLCPHCHRDTPAAQGLLAFFAVHERITHDTVPTAAALIRQWMTAAVAYTYTGDDLAEDIRRWQAGDM